MYLNIILIFIQFKIDEYFLGKVGVKVKKGPLRREEMDEDEEEDDNDKDDPLEKPPRFYFNGKSYPYHEVSMGLGTVCDINNVPRSITIKYICDMESHQSGTVSVCVYGWVCVGGCVGVLPQIKHYVYTFTLYSLSLSHTHTHTHTSSLSHTFPFSLSNSLTIASPCR